jgi:hypothetical protein
MDGKIRRGSVRNYSMINPIVSYGFDECSPQVGWPVHPVRLNLRHPKMRNQDSDFGR